MVSLVNKLAINPLAKLKTQGRQGEGEEGEGVAEHPHQAQTAEGDSRDGDCGKHAREDCEPCADRPGRSGLDDHPEQHADRVLQPDGPWQEDLRRVWARRSSRTTCRPGPSTRWSLARRSSPRLGSATSVVSRMPPNASERTS